MTHRKYVKVKSSQLCLFWILQFQVTALALKDIFYVKQNCKTENHQIFCRDINLQNKHLNFEQLNGTYKLYFLRTNLHILEENVFNNIQIEHLSIIGSPLTTIDKNAFFGQEDVLKTLELSTTNLTAITDFTAIQNLYNLETLEIKNFYINGELNNFTSINLTKLTKLSLRNNRIRYFKTNAFLHLGNLTQLVIRDNKLENIPLPETFKFLHNLRHLDMSDNNIKEISRGNLQENRKLEILYLMQNSISKVDDFAFENIENSLQHLNLGLNRITEDHLKHLKNFSKLESLNLNQNIIKNLAGDIFQNMNKLKTLSLKNNQLTKLRKIYLKGLNNLKELFLNENQLLIEVTAMAGVPLLEILYLDNQKLKETMEIKWLRNTSETLKKLSLKGNNFNDTDLWAAIRTLSHLEFLDLSKCNLEKIPVFAFEHNLKLEVIKLNDNRIQTLEEGAFEGLQNCLEYIELINNQLQVIDECVFNNFNWPKTRAFHIDLTNNKLICNCSLHWLQILMQESINKSNDNYFYFKNWWCYGMNGKEIIYSTNLNCELNRSKTDCVDFGARYTTQTTQEISTMKSSTTDNVSTQTKLETVMQTSEESPTSTKSSVPIPSTISFEKPKVSIKLERRLLKVEISWKISDLFWVKYFTLEILETFPNQESNKTLILIHKSTQFYTYYYLNPYSILHVCIIVNVTAKSNLIDACEILHPKEKPSSPITNNKHTLEIGLGVGVSVSVLVLVILLCLLYRKYKQNKEHTYEEPKSSERTEVHLTPKSKRYERKRSKESSTISVVSDFQLQPEQQHSAGSYQYLDNLGFRPDETYEEIQSPSTLQQRGIENNGNIRREINIKRVEDERLPINNIPMLSRSHLSHVQRPLPSPPNKQDDILDSVKLKQLNPQLNYATIEYIEAD